jgi:hypothetical protein
LEQYFHNSSKMAKYVQYPSYRKKLSDVEFNYDVYDKEMLAIVYALEKWRQFLHGSAFTTTIYSDHQNLSYFTQKVVLNRRQARWALILKSYTFVIVYRNGSANQKADILSRCPAYTFREGRYNSDIDGATVGTRTMVGNRSNGNRRRRVSRNLYRSNGG